MGEGLPLQELIDNLQKGEAVHVDVGTDYALLTIDGADAVGFLQRRTSNDLHDLKNIGDTQVNSFLDKTANIRCLFQLWRTGKHQLTALVERCLLDVFIEEAARFRIMETFTVSVNDDAQLALFLSKEVETSPLVLTHDVMTFQNPVLVMGKSAAKGCIMTGGQSHRPRLREASLPLQLDQFRQLQTLFGVPRFGDDYSHETKLPETGWENDAVSYTKGCYLGQETVAKMKTYGGAKHTLMGLRLSAQTGGVPLPNPPPKGEGVRDENGKKIGLWGSSVVVGEETIAMAYLNRDHREPGKTIQLKLDDGLAQDPPLQMCNAKVELLPFLNLNEAEGDTAKRLYASAMSLFVSDQIEEATTLMTRVIQSYPKYWDAREGLAVLLGRQERYQEAVNVLLALIEDNPNHVMAYTNLSIYTLRLGDKDGAETWTAQGTRVAMRLAMEAAMAKKRETQSDEQIQKEANEANQKRRAMMTERVTLFDAALLHAPTDALALYGKATALQEIERFAEARGAFEATIEHNPKHSQAYVGLAQCLQALGDVDALKALLPKAIEMATHRGDMQPVTRLKDIQASLT